MKIKDFLNNGQFNVYGNVRIYSYRRTEENGDECILKWSGCMGGVEGCALPDDTLMDRDIDGVYITPVGNLEIEYYEQETN